MQKGSIHTVQHLYITLCMLSSHVNLTLRIPQTVAFVPQLLSPCLEPADRNSQSSQAPSLCSNAK